MLLLVRYDELRVACRRKLKLKPSELPEASLKGLYCVLDANDDDSVRADELKSFH